jgi:rhamnogalacturonan endolyase
VGGEQPVKLTSEPVFRTTDFLDAGAQKTEQPVEYSVRAVVKGAEVSGDKPATARLAGEETGYLRIPLRGSYQVQKAGIADLDGDGKLDYVIKQPIDNIDPADDYWKTSPDTYKLEAYLSDGTFLWQHDMGWDIERGIWYSPYVVYDLDGDGRAEVACKAGEGDHRGEDGRVKSGPEYLDILDGMTGKLRCRTDWVPRSEFRGVDYNRTSRNQLCVAYLDGKTPCLVVDRGTYNLIILVAYEFHDGRLRELWRWSNSRTSRRYWGQGAHWMHGADVDRDGRDEVVVGSAVIDDNGQELWSTGLGHPDHCYVGDLDPERPGLEIYYGIEPSNPKNSMCMVDAATGKILWGYDQRTVHIHSSGLVSDIDPSHPGSECYSGERDEKEKRWLRDCRGNVIAMADIGSLAPRAAYWDSDAQREIVARGAIKKFNGPVLEPKIEGSVVAVADILGDWREEIITTVPGEMRIHVSTIPAADRRTWLMADPVYRMDVVCAAMGYYQVPMLGTDIAARKR